MRALWKPSKLLPQTDRLVAIHAEDRQMLAATEEKLKQAKKAAPTDYLRAHTEAAEVYAVKRTPQINPRLRC